MNSLTASFNTTMAQMTEMSQRKKWPKCLSEKKKIRTVVWTIARTCSYECCVCFI